MSATDAGRGRLRAYFEFVAAVLYFFLVRSLAGHAAQGLVNEQWSPLVGQAILAFLLLVGYAGFGIWVDRQSSPISSQGFPRRSGWQSEVGIGLATGWALAVICALLLMLIGGIAIVLSTERSAWSWLAGDTAFFLLFCLAEEVAFRGYSFQRFAHAVGPVGAAVGFAAFYAIVQAQTPGSNRASIAVSIALSLVLSSAYLRTRALWLSWGLNFGWKASRALLFGLAVSGVNSHSPVVQGDPMGPFWLTGGGYGLDGSWAAFILLLLGLPVIFKVTRDLDFRYNAPVIVPGGIPVDIDAPARRQHETAMGTTGTVTPPLVQIAPASQAPLSVLSHVDESEQPVDSHLRKQA